MRFCLRDGIGVELRRGRGRGGWTLLELIGLLMLLSVAAVVLGEVFKVSYQANRGSTRKLETLNRLDSMLSVLRRDVWEAEEISQDGRLVQVEEGREMVRWNFRADGRVVRRAEAGGVEGAGREWEGLPMFEVETRKGCVILRTGAEDRVVLVSQRIVGGGDGKAGGVK